MSKAMTSADMRRWIAELIGTFFLTCAGISAIMLTVQLNLPPGPAQPAAVSILLIAFAHGAALALAVYSLGPISGPHVNPAVSFSLFIAVRISQGGAFSFLFQVVGAVVAGMEAHLSHELSLAACPS